MGDRGENSLGAVIFAGIVAGLLICWVWKIMWGRRREDNDDNHGHGGEDRSGDSGHISSAGSHDGHISFALSNNSSGHISFAPTDDEESGGGHVAMSRTNSDHICMSRSSTSSSSGYCISDFHAPGATTDYQLTPHDYRSPV